MNWLRGGDSREDHFDEPDEFVPEHLPEPDGFLEGHDVLTGDRHLEIHAIARERFEQYGVYDMTFGYNLAKLNRDQRHPDAGFRYGEPADGSNELLASFTPTTKFCPQSDTLGIGAFRAWNRASDGEKANHGCDIVRVRVHDMHQASDSTNDRLRELEAEYERTGQVPGGDEA